MHRENSTGRDSMCNINTKITARRTIKKNQISVPNIDLQNIKDEKELRLIKCREAIEQQRELHENESC